jgi:DNA-directed RNA polymerase subunit H (RpoH/RPB5)
MAQSTHIVEVFKSRNIILSLLERQGYNITNYQGSSINEVHSMYQTKQMDMLVTNEENNKKAYIKYHLNKNLRHNNIYDYIEDLYNLEQILTKQDDLIIVIKDEPNEPLLKILSNIWEQDEIFITVFNITRLQFNILEHTLVPPHRKLLLEEANDIKKKYNITDDSQIPDISRFSPVAQAIALRPGDLCEIIRPSRTSITSKFYRICS